MGGGGGGSRVNGVALSNPYEAFDQNKNEVAKRRIWAWKQRSGTGYKGGRRVGRRTRPPSLGVKLSSVGFTVVAGRLYGVCDAYPRLSVDKSQHLLVLVMNPDS